MPLADAEKRQKCMPGSFPVCIANFDNSSLRVIAVYWRVFFKTFQAKCLELETTQHTARFHYSVLAFYNDHRFTYICEILKLHVLKILAQLQKRY